MWTKKLDHCLEKLLNGSMDLFTPHCMTPAPLTPTKTTLCWTLLSLGVKFQWEIFFVCLLKSTVYKYNCLVEHFCSHQKYLEILKFDYSEFKKKEYLTLTDFFLFHKHYFRIDQRCFWLSLFAVFSTINGRDLHPSYSWWISWRIYCTWSSSPWWPATERKGR